MDKESFIDRISFPTEYHSESDLKSSVALLFITCIIFFILSSVAVIFNLFLFSKTLLLGTLAYEFILFYLLEEYTKKFIKKEIKGKAQKTLDVTSRLIFSFLILITFIALVYSMLSPVPADENKLFSLFASLIIIALPTFFWHELVIFFKKNFKGSFKLLGVIFFSLFLLSSCFASDELINETVPDEGFFSQIQEGFETLGRVADFFSNVKESISNAQDFIQNVFSLTTEQTQIILIIVVLIGAFFVLKFLSVIVKWVIIILIVWIIIQMLIL